MNRSLGIVFVAFLATLAQYTQAQVTSCDAAVTLEGAEIHVSPGSDDRAALQCAFDEAVERGVQTIRLAAGIYELADAVEIANFVGRLQGRSSEQTTVRHAGESAFIFHRGAPSIRSMTIEATRQQGDVTSIDFRGSESNCNQRVIFAEIDRVDFVAPEPEPATFQYAFRAENPSCDNPRLLGSLTVNRSSFSGYRTAGRAVMGDAARIVIRTNRYENVGICMFVSESNADFSFLGNICNFNGLGVGSSNLGDDVDRNYMRIRENRFHSTGTSFGRCIVLENTSTRSVGASIEKNTCEIEGVSAATNPGAIYLDGLDAPSIVDNIFRGTMDIIVVDNTNDLFINRNEFSSQFVKRDISIGPGSRRTVMEAAAGSLSVRDLGIDTIYLPQ
ncbi:MAG: hypothetical protein V2I82_08280 [Halieaceae bacterium]|jgi:hypothetical protein|nr:hypothetical protein [Halieaceae bacterium]